MRRSRFSFATPAGRWIAVGAVVIVAVLVAVWPRSAAAPAPAGRGPAAAPSMSGDATLAAPRRTAALRPCPLVLAGAPASRGPLAGVTAPCLGAPGSVDLGTALADRTVLLNLWASWCGPCRDEMPVLAAYAGQPGAVLVLGVDVRDDPNNALGLAAGLGVHYPSVFDPDGTLQRALGAPPVLPVSYLLHPDGTLRRVTQPLVFHTPDEVRAAIP